jgi:hypothetical protein
MSRCHQRLVLDAFHPPRKEFEVFSCNIFKRPDTHFVSEQTNPPGRSNLDLENMKKELFEKNLERCTGKETVILHYFHGVHTELGGIYGRSGVFFAGTPESLSEIVSAASEWKCRVDVLAVGESTSHPAASMDSVQCFECLSSEEVQKIADAMAAADVAGQRLRGGPVSEEEKGQAILKPWQEADNLTDWGWLVAVAYTTALNHASA